MAKPHSYNRKLQTPGIVKGRIGTLPATPKPAPKKHLHKVIRTKPKASPEPEPEYNPDIGAPPSFEDPSVFGLKEILSEKPEPVEPDPVAEPEEPVADPEPPADDPEPEPATEPEGD